MLGKRGFWAPTIDRGAWLLCDPDRELTHGCQAAAGLDGHDFMASHTIETKHPLKAKRLALSNYMAATREQVVRIVAILKPVV